jgi:DNA (cytosine-5)-methyltransferase 1
MKANLWFTKRRRAQSVDDYETWIEGGVSPTLNVFDNGTETRATVLIIDGTRVDDVRIYEDEIIPCLKHRMGTGGNNVPLITQVTSHDVVGTLQERNYKGPNHENARDGQLIIMQEQIEPIGFSHTQGLDCQPSAEAWPTLRREGGGQAVAIPIQGTIIGRSDTAGPQGPGFGQEGDPCFTLDTISQHGVAFAYDEYNDSVTEEGPHHAIRAGTKQSTGVVVTHQVRRLTPIECERLMGWPDNHTLHRADGKSNADTTRYKMCGNGVASPVAQWIAEQINAILP